ncbi:MAG: hypothetical protein HY720_33155 [Planctomycetes bacterium]|nr:hypothetical protein [Planctomycetota bacterium]
MTGGLATAVALLAGLFGAVLVAGCAGAGKTDRARASEAEDCYAQGRAAWQEAERSPFNPAAPQD